MRNPRPTTHKSALKVVVFCPPAIARPPRVIRRPSVAKPAIDAYALLASWRLARRLGDRARAFELFSALERLAERPRRRTVRDRDDAAEGGHDEQ